MERSFFMVKPDGVERGLIGEIISRIEKKGLRIVAMEMLRVDKALARKHYAEHKGKPFFEDLVAYITSGPCVAMVVEGENAINILREMIGKTNPKEAAAGTIRGDFGIDVRRNVVHASDSQESAKREIALFFRGSTG
ncbi:MAG: nucleoside-diphosphate kinase [Methanobacteriota archaeon]